MEITAKTEVSTKEIALILGVTARWIQQLTQDGILTKTDRGRYVLSDAIKVYANYRRRKEAEVTDLEKSEAELSIKQAKAIVFDMEAKELQSKMHRAEDVAAMTEDLIETIRSALKSLTGRLAANISNVTVPSEAAHIIREEVYVVMRELSEYKYDPEKHAERVRERRNRDTEMDC